MLCDAHEDHKVLMGTHAPDITSCPVCIVDWITCAMMEFADNPEAIRQTARKAREFVDLVGPGNRIRVLE